MKIFFTLFLLITSTAFSKIKITTKPVVFKEVRAQSSGNYKSRAVARGVIEIYSDNLEEDFGKLVTFSFPEYTYITNHKRWVKTDKIVFKKNEKDVIIDSENKKIIFHVVLDKKELSKEENRELIDGIYVGILPMNYSIYSKEM
ncbi:MAG: hypothetical protein ACRCYM_00420 [Cetobacterium sp.]